MEEAGCCKRIGPQPGGRLAVGSKAARSHCGDEGSGLLLSLRLLTFLLPLLLVLSLLLLLLLYVTTVPQLLSLFPRLVHSPYYFATFADVVARILVIM